MTIKDYLKVIAALLGIFVQYNDPSRHKITGDGVIYSAGRPYFHLFTKFSTGYVILCTYPIYSAFDFSYIDDANCAKYGFSQVVALGKALEAA